LYKIFYKKIKLEKLMSKTISILSFLFLSNQFLFAQNPSDTPCTAPTINVSKQPGIAINHYLNLCCSAYANFLGSGPSCGKAMTDRDAWFKIGSMTIGEQYNFMYIETGNRQTWIEVFELPAGQDCAVASNYKSVKCARANNVAFYPKTSISATFVPKNATSSYFVRFQRLNVSDEALDGTFSITKSYPNEEPCGATLLQVQPQKGTSPILGNNITAADWKPDLLTAEMCGSNNDIWYKFVATSCAMEVFVDNLSEDIFELQAAILTSNEGDCNIQSEVVPCGGMPDQYLDVTLSSDNLTIGKTYYIIIDGYAPPYFNAVGNFSIEVYKKPVQPDCSKISSLPDADISFLKIYPNPSNNTLNIISTWNFQELFITDLVGKRIKNIDNHSFQNEYKINTSEMNNGLYFIQGLNDVGVKVVQRFIVQH
jgi:hypothetical protein